DGAGNDTYTAGNFSQATGYYMALGVLADDKGNDTYNVTRYGQGVGCHSAVGVMLEGGGDDTYNGRIAANQGASWDAGVGVLIERGGDDRYNAPGLSIGAAAMNGFGLVFEAGGNDTYNGRPKAGLGRGTKNDYWWGRGGAGSLGILIEAGPGSDTGLTDKKEGPFGETRTGGAFGLFVDREGGLMEILAGDPDIEALKRREREQAAERGAEAAHAARDAAAKKAYDAAEALFGKKKFAEAAKAFERAAAEFDGVPWAERAAARAKEIASDPAIRAAIGDQKAKKDCTRWLGLGRSYLDNGRPKDAKRYFQKVIDTYPDTRYADEAQGLLKGL
ncbi:MAG: tetratricopeptide repeat protein, partial [Planctomycetota bacterium]